MMRSIAVVVCASICGFLAVQPAYAGAFLRPEAVLAANTLTVGDVFEDAGAFATRYLAPAPQPGAQMTLNAEDLARISRAFNLGWVAQTGRETLSVRRAGVDAPAMTAAIQERLSADFPGQKFEIAIKNPSAAFLPTAVDAPQVEAQDVKVDPAKGVFEATLHILGGQHQVSGRLSTLIDMPVLKKPITAGSIVGAEDVVFVEMRGNEVGPGVVSAAEDMIGRAARRGLSAMRPVMAADLAVPPMVKKGESVTIALSEGALSLTLRGRVLDTGAQGDVVRVVNTTSNKTFDAVVTARQSVTIRPSAL